LSPLDDLRISVSQAGDQNEVMILRLDGMLDTLTAPNLDRVIGQLLQQKKYNLVCDLAGVNYVSSAGWGIFISHIKEVRENQGDLKLTRLHPDVYEIFELLEFDTVIKSYESVDKATGDFSTAASLAAEKPTPPAVATLTLPDPLPVSDEVAVSSSTLGLSLTTATITLEEKVLALVQEDPLLRISEMKALLKSSRFGEQKVSFRRIFFILSRNSLLRLRSRCLYSRQTKKSF
jgi:anti-sigma B factor antagonist